MKLSTFVHVGYGQVCWGVATTKQKRKMLARTGSRSVEIKFVPLRFSAAACFACDTRNERRKMGTHPHHGATLLFSTGSYLFPLEASNCDPKHTAAPLIIAIFSSLSIKQIVSCKVFQWKGEVRNGGNFPISCRCKSSCKVRRVSVVCQLKKKSLLELRLCFLL